MLSPRAKTHNYLNMIMAEKPVKALAPDADKGPWKPVENDPFGLLQPGEHATPPPMSDSTRFFVVPAGGPWSYLMSVAEPVARSARPQEKQVDDLRAAIRLLKVERHLWPTAMTHLPKVEALLAEASHISGGSPMAKGKTIYYTLWNAVNGKADVIPDLTPYLSVWIRECVDEWENQACGYTGSIATQRFVAKGGMKTVNADAKRRASTQAGGVLATSAMRDMRPVGGMRRGDVLRQTGGVAGRMRSAIDDGWILHARVLSGVGYGEADNARAYDAAAAKGRPPHQPVPIGKPPEEHSIMIIGYEGSEFVFWDPDTGSSKTHGSGFGSLYANGSSLTTAASDADLPVSDDGYQASGAHRYQVILFGSQ